MARHVSWLGLWLAIAAAAQSGCAPPPPRSPASLKDDAYPGELVDSRSLPDGLFVRQRIDARFGEQRIGFSAVLQTDGGVLSLLALTPYGTRAFLLEQEGQQVRFTRYVDRELPFPSRFILLDVHRTLFAGLPGAPLTDGVHAGERGGERIAERWQAGALLERTFERIDGKPAGLIRIAYHGGMRGRVPPAKVELDNGWFGYRLEIETLKE